MRLRVVVFSVPVIFMFLSNIVPYEKMSWNIPEYSKPFPEYLKPPEDAELFRYTNFNHKYEPPNFIGVEYEVNEPYPAQKIRDFLTKELEDVGFSMLDFDLEFPTMQFSRWGGRFSRKFGSLENPSPGDFTTWVAYWIRETDNVLLKVHLWCYEQKTRVTIETSRPVGWSRRAIKLRHQIQFYKLHFVTCGKGCCNQYHQC